VSTNLRRVCIVGMGAVTAYGVGVEKLWEGVSHGVVAIRPVVGFNTEGFGSALGGEVTEPAAPEREYRRPEDHREPAIDFALLAAEQAMRSAGIGFDVVRPDRWGVVIGTCNAGLESGESWYLREMDLKQDGSRLRLQLVPPHALAETLAVAYRLRGPALSVNTACAAGANALGYAADLIRLGKADAVLTGGSDALSPIVYAGFTSLESLSPLPAAPYSRDRHGLSLGEGSGMLVLVSEEAALRAGAKPLAVLAGYGLSADGYHPTAPRPEGDGAARAITAALYAACVDPAAVDYINGHGTGTPKNDPAETRAIHLALGEHARHVMVSSTKSMIGHLLGAAGAVEAIVTIKALAEQIAPPTANFGAADPECDLDYVPNHSRPARINVAMSNNFAFGGANASLVLVNPDKAGDAQPGIARRVVVSGLSLITSAGCETGPVWEALRTFRVCTVAENGYRVGRVDFDSSRYLSPRDTRRMDRLGVFSVSASKAALADAALTVDNDNRARIGVIFATGIGPMDSMETFARPLMIEGPGAANPAVFPNVVYNAAAGHVGIHTGAVGPTSTVTAGHAAGASAVCYAHDLVADGRAEGIIAVGADTLTDTLIKAYAHVGVFASRGFAVSEGAAAVLVESADAAAARGATPYGEIHGYGMTFEALPDRRGLGIERAMRLGLEEAGWTPADIDWVWAGYTGHVALDRAESAAMRRLFGSKLRVYSPKRMLGETMGVGGIISLALALSSEPTATQTRVLVNSSSLGGSHFSLALTSWGRGTAVRNGA